MTVEKVLFIVWLYRFVETVLFPLIEEICIKIGKKIGVKIRKVIDNARKNR